MLRLDFLSVDFSARFAGGAFAVESSSPQQRPNIFLI
jgi:hypothetical protein